MNKSRLLVAVCAIFFAPYTYSAGLSTYTLLQTNVNDYPGTIDTNTSVVSPSTASVSLNQINGSSVYDGAASATATYGTLQVSAMADLTNYSMNSYFDCFGDDGTGFPLCFGATAAYAQASYTDTLTIDNLQSDGLLHMTFSVDRIMDLTGTLASGQGYISISSGGTGVGTSDSARFFDSGSSTVELILSAASGIPLNIVTSLSANVTPEDWCGTFGELCGPTPTTYDASMLADFSNTVTLTELLVTDLNNNPLAGINIQSESGTIYPVSPLNAVPIPAAVWLFGSGLIGLIGLARRKA